MSDHAPAWPEDEYLAFDGGAFVKAALKPCLSCKSELWDVVERPNGSVWAECPECREKKHGRRNGRLVARLDMVAKRLVPVNSAN